MAGSDHSTAPSIPVRPDVAVVLAGGLGTRLRDVLPDRPKALAPAAGEPFISYLLAYLAGQGILQVILALGHLAEPMQAYVGRGERWNLAIQCVTEELPLGTAGAARLASADLTGPFFVVNGDTLFAIKLDDLWVHHLRRQAAATIALRPVEQNSQERSKRGVIVLGKDGLIQQFLEKPSSNQSGSTDQIVYTNGGVYLLAPQVLQSVPLGQAYSLETQVFPALANAGQLGGFVQDAYFTDIGTPESLAGFEADVLAGRLERVQK